MKTNNIMPAYHYKNLAKIEDTYWWHQGKIFAAISFLKPYLKKNIVSLCRLADIGCGTGGFLKSIKSRLDIHNVIGIDGNELAVERSQKRGLNTQIADLNNYFLINCKPYNIITAMDVLEHIENEQVFLKTISENLSPEGLFLINVPAYNFLFSSWDKVLGHKRRYSSCQLTKILKKNNFRVIKITYLFAYIFPFAVFRRLLGPEYTEKTCVFPRTTNFLNSS
ncbi:MAG: class I SAM-dependent methyltransferase, partial [Candidatus Omnitrophica bacterium]|nr:class I SAM-dependent methyltransferase [Candidatus Omnitrophota bacterium]